MNSNRRVFAFVVYSVGFFLLLSIAAYFFHFNFFPLHRVNLVSDVIREKKDSSHPPPPDTAALAPVIITPKPLEDFSLYQSAHLITDFHADTNRASLAGFLQKLQDLKSGKKRKVRIAYFGDSMIEGDLLSQTLRKLLQQEFGGSGVGYVPITSVVSKFRITATASFSDDWQDENFKEGKSNKLFISGHLFRAANSWVQITDQTLRDSAIVEKALLCGNAGGNVSISYNNRSFNFNAGDPFNRTVLARDPGRSIKIAVNNPQLPLYGVTFESDSGVFVDNFSFRGITGLELGKIDSSFLSTINDVNPYDLVIFQYGVNLLFRPNDLNFGWYGRAILPVVNRLKHCFPTSDFLMVSTADRAFRYNGGYKSAIGIDSLVKVQALVAYESGSSFYNQFESMGGTNSIVDWVKQTPSLANKDYIHPNFRGAEILGHYFFEAIMKEYKKYLQSSQK